MIVKKKKETKTKTKITTEVKFEDTDNKNLMVCVMNSGYTDISLHRVVSVELSDWKYFNSLKCGKYRSRTLTSTDEDGIKTEITLYS